MPEAKYEEGDEQNNVQSYALLHVGSAASMQRIRRLYRLNRLFTKPCLLYVYTYTLYMYYICIYVYILNQNS